MNKFIYKLLIAGTTLIGVRLCIVNTFIYYNLKVFSTIVYLM